MTFRTISHLQRACICSAPPNIPQARLKGKKAAGLRYERQLAKVLPSAIHGQWFQFFDANGPGFCQPDFCLVPSKQDNTIIVLEAKYTWCPEAHDQLWDLYVPVVQKSFQMPTFGAVVCKNLRPGMNGCAIFNTFRDIAEASRSYQDRGRYVWYWLGQATSRAGGPEPLPNAAVGHPLTVKP